jgi:hypothetical protein
MTCCLISHHSAGGTLTCWGAMSFKGRAIPWTSAARCARKPLVRWMCCSTTSQRSRPVHGNHSRTLILGRKATVPARRSLENRENGHCLSHCNAENGYLPFSEDIPPLYVVTPRSSTALHAGARHPQPEEQHHCEVNQRAEQSWLGSAWSAHPALRSCTRRGRTEGADPSAPKIAVWSTFHAQW